MDVRFSDDLVPEGSAPVAGIDTWQTCPLPADKMADMALTVQRRCSDGMMNYAETGIDCGGACDVRCGACQCSYNGRSGTVATPFSYGSGNMCGTHLNGTNGTSSNVYICYVHEPNSCTSPDSMTYVHAPTQYELAGAVWVFCTPTANELRETSSCGDGGSSLAPSASSTVLNQEVWYCDGAMCYACNTPECLVEDCATFQTLKAYFPMTVQILFSMTVA